VSRLRDNEVDFEGAPVEAADLIGSLPSAISTDAQAQRSAERQLSASGKSTSSRRIV
jgi:hypothetical protein